jgi:hypothetical protein
MPIPWKAVRGGFVDGYAACLLMFRKTIRVPGSESEELIKLTTPEMLAQYRAARPEWEDVLLKMREISLNHDRTYALMVRIVGSIELAAIVAAICFLAAHGRL